MNGIFCNFYVNNGDDFYLFIYFGAWYQSTRTFCHPYGHMSFFLPLVPEALFLLNWSGIHCLVCVAVKVWKKLRLICQRDLRGTQASGSGTVSFQHPFALAEDMCCIYFLFKHGRTVPSRTHVTALLLSSRWIVSRCNPHFKSAYNRSKVFSGLNFTLPYGFLAAAVSPWPLFCVISSP